MAAFMSIPFAWLAQPSSLRAVAIASAASAIRLVLEDDSPLLRAADDTVRRVGYGGQVMEKLRAVWRLWRRYWFDLTIVAFTAIAACEVIFRWDDEKDRHLHGSTPLMAAWAAAFVLPLLFRRRFPFGAPVAVFVIGLAGSFWNPTLATYTGGNFFGVIAATFLFGMLYDRSRSAIGYAVAVSTAAIVVHNDPSDSIGDFAFIVFILSVAWFAGLALGSQLRSKADALERAERAERERELRALAAVSEERARIARELHDIVGHSVSVMTVQASAVRRLLREDQEREREALQVVEETGRAALAEMRRLVGVLRRPEEAPTLVPQPSLEYVDKLVEQTREAGLETKLRLEGAPTELPQGIDLTAYRFVQEGLTNAIKHANAKHAEVVVRYDNGSVELVVRDDGTGDGKGGGSGHGLVGIRERVAVYGGELTAGPRPEGGYELRARLPVTAE
jgi:signal transduction histidine kinase